MRTFKKNVQLFSVFLIFSLNTIAQKSVLTQHNDLERTGLYDQETILNQSNVRPGSFGKLYSRPLDGFNYAQPLVVFNVAIPGKGIRNVLYVATINNTLYAFDADSASVTAPYWSINLTPALSRVTEHDDLSACVHGNDFLTAVGIVGTPAIDSLTNTLYVVARSYDTVNKKYEQYLHALDITNGTERPGSPKAITASVNGTGEGNVNGVINFDPLRQNQRAGLLLLNGDVIICWGSHCDWQPYHGWIMSFDKTTLDQKIVYNISPNGEGGGIWMCGGGPSADGAGNIYITAGDGTAGTPENPSDIINRGLSVVKLTPSGSSISVSDFFTPKNFLALDADNRDLVTQVMLIPNSNLAMACGKDGLIYIMDRNNMGGYHADTNMIAQTYAFPTTAAVHTNFSYYEGSQKGYAYFWAGKSDLFAFPYNYTSGKFDLDSTVISTALGATNIYGASMSISSNGNIDSTAIVWASHIESGSYPPEAPRPGRLRAFAANDIHKELWNSGIFIADSVRSHAKYVSPTIANGKVYMGTYSNELIVYGLTGNAVNTCGDVNVALNKPAFASSVSGNNVASRATDGKIDKRWISEAGDPQSIYIDLGAKYEICKVIIKWKNNKALDFKIQVSDDAVSWHTVTTVKTNGYVENNFLLSGTGRFVRMYGTRSKGNSGYAMQEFEVYGNLIPPVFAAASAGSNNKRGNK